MIEIWDVKLNNNISLYSINLFLFFNKLDPFLWEGGIKKYIAFLIKLLRGEGDKVRFSTLLFSCTYHRAKPSNLP